MELDTFRNNACSVIAGGVAGFSAGSLIIAGGKAWIWMKNMNKPVHELLGHVSTPAFRRQLVVGSAVYILSNTLLKSLKVTYLPKLNKKSMPLFYGIYKFSKHAVALTSAVGSALMVNYVNHSAYKVLTIAALAYAVLEFAVANLLPTSKSKGTLIA